MAKAYSIDLREQTVAFVAAEQLCHCGAASQCAPRHLFLRNANPSGMN